MKDVPAKHPDWILTTKLNRPPPPPDLVRRGRLIELLQENPDRSLTLVSAPAGYGKSTLISDWLAPSTRKLPGATNEIERPGVWLSLDEEDNDLRAFLRYFIEAVRGHSPKACGPAYELLSAMELPSPVILGKLLSNGLQAIKRPFVLVLDDYHGIHGQAVHELLDQLLRYPSCSFHLVMVTRHDPPISLALLRAQGRLLEIRERDLRFTPDETRDVIQSMGRVSLTDDTISHVHAELEGWIAGLRLVCLSLRNEPDPETFLAGLQGGTLGIQEYLIEEVLRRLPSGFKECLLKTSILNRFCVDLCAHLCESDGCDISGEEFIRRLEKANLFLIRLDERGAWYRYHHLFQQILQQQLGHQSRAEDLAALHARAGSWLEEAGLIDEALQHLLAAGDLFRAADLVERHRLAKLNEDQWFVLQKWMDRLPADIKEQRVALLLAEGWIQNFSFQLNRIPSLIQRAEAALDGRPAEPALLGELNYFRGVLLYWDGESESSRRCLEDALETMDAEQTMIAGEARLYHALACHMRGEGRSAVDALEKKILSADPGNVQYLNRLTAGQTVVFHLLGDLVPALHTAQRVLMYGVQSKSIYAENWGHYTVGLAHLHAGRFDTAVPCFLFVSKHRDLFERDAAIDALSGLALSYQLLEQPEKARKVMDELSVFARELGAPKYRVLTDACSARLALLRGELHHAVIWSHSVEFAPRVIDSFIWLTDPLMTQIRIWIAEGEAERLLRAIDMLGELRSQSEAIHFTAQAIEISVLQSLACEKLARREESLDVLREVVSRAESRGWVRPFIEAGPPMADLLRLLLDQETGSHYIEHILSFFTVAESSEQAGRPEQQVDACLIEALSNREVDILELLAKRLSNKEIAEELSIALSTVKSHLKHIYAKLGAQGRRDAVEKADGFGLLR